MGPSPYPPEPPSRWFVWTAAAGSVATADADAASWLLAGGWLLPTFLPHKPAPTTAITIISFRRRNCSSSSAQTCRAYFVVAQPRLPQFWPPSLTPPPHRPSQIHTHTLPASPTTEPATVPARAASEQPGSNPIWSAYLPACGLPAPSPNCIHLQRPITPQLRLRAYIIPYTCSSYGQAPLSLSSVSSFSIRLPVASSSRQGNDTCPPCLRL